MRVLLLAGLLVRLDAEVSVSEVSVSDLKVLLPAFSPNFDDLASRLPIQFDPAFKNPCWWDTAPDALRHATEEARRGGRVLLCLPYAYLAGFPKCGRTGGYLRISLACHARAISIVIPVRSLSLSPSLPPSLGM